MRPGVGLPPDTIGAAAAFVGPVRRDLCPDRDAVAAETVAFPRLSACRHPEDLWVNELVGEPPVTSEDFRRLRADHRVEEKTKGSSRSRTPRWAPTAERPALPGSAAASQKWYERDTLAQHTLNTRPAH
ncbi:MmyB family transcriptional regulator [Streptomyces sp. NPDC001970]